MRDSFSGRDVPYPNVVLLRGGISIETGIGRGSKPLSRSSTNIAFVIALHRARVVFSRSRLLGHESLTGSIIMPPENTRSGSGTIVSQ